MPRIEFNKKIGSYPPGSQIIVANLNSQITINIREAIDLGIVSVVKNSVIEKLDEARIVPDNQTFAVIAIVKNTILKEISELVPAIETRKEIETINKICTIIEEI